jgi:poly(A) polymerase
MKITAPRWLSDLAQIYSSESHQLFLVGGAVRDQLLDKPVNEWDCATDALPSKTEHLLRKAGVKGINKIGERFGTIVGNYHGEVVEITTFRSEEYSEYSRNPEVKFGTDIESDLARRDFTINAIAYDLQNSKILDPHNGVADINNRRIHAVGRAVDRFREDPLRMLRAIRLAAVLGFTIGHETLSAITTERERFSLLSIERVNQEVSKMLLAKSPSAGIKLLVETGLITYILPELLPSIDLEFDAKEHKDIYAHILQVLDNTPPKLELRWCALLHDIAKPLTRKKIGGEYHFLGHEVVGARMAKQILRRLKYSNEFVEYVSKLTYLHQRIPNDDGSWTDGAVRRFVRDAGELLEDLFIFAEADSTGKNERKLQEYRKKRENLKKRITQLEQEAEIAKIKSPLSGDELVELFHRKPGPWIKPIKDELLRMVLDNELHAEDKKKAVEIARRLAPKG